MFGLSWLKIGIYGLATLAVTTTIGLGYWRYTSILSEREALRADKIRLETAVEVQQQTIAAQGEAIAEWEESQQNLLAVIEEMQAVQRAAGEESRRLRNVFERYDLEVLSLRRPGLIERRIDAGTARINCLLEHATAGTSGSDC